MAANTASLSQRWGEYQTTIDAVRMLRQPPDAVVVTGDLVDFGRPAEIYRRGPRTRLTPKAWATLTG